MDELRAYYYSFAPTGQREVDLILHAVARAGKAFHHTSQWTEDEMAEFYEHCEGNTCVEWIQNAANKAAAELATLRARVAELERDEVRLGWLVGKMSEGDLYRLLYPHYAIGSCMPELRAAIDATRAGDEP